MTEINYSEIEELLGWRTTPKLNLEHGNLTVDPSEEKISRLLTLVGEPNSVLGVDIFRYSKMDPHQQLLVPMLLDQILEGCSNLLASAHYIFDKKPISQSITEKIDTGDGFFLVFNTPLHALMFCVTFEALLRYYNSYSFLPDTRAIVGPLSYRMALSRDLVHAVRYRNERKNFYGKGIILCARMLARDRLNRFLVDRNTIDWFMENIKGIENVPLLELNQLVALPDFLGNDERLISDSSPLIDNVNSLHKDDGIKDIQVLRLFDTEEKGDQLELYCIQIRAAVRLFSNSQNKNRLVNVTVGNLNTEGIAL